MKSMAELKGLNMVRILVEYSNGFRIAGYYKDGLIQLDGQIKWTHPNKFERFILLDDIN